MSLRRKQRPQSVAPLRVRAQMSQCVGELLSRLPEGYRTVLALSDCEELSDREIAAILGVTVGAAKIRLHRARTRLRQELERDCSFYRDDRNVLCCDRKEARAEGAYPLEDAPRLQVRSRGSAASQDNLNEEKAMTAVDVLPTKQEQLIGVGASIAAGCQPCTLSFAAAAREAGAYEREVRFAIESGLSARESATTGMSAFSTERLAHPEVDAAFRAEKAMLEALIGVAAAVAGNAASLIPAKVHGARALGATDSQILLAAEIGRTARRGAERVADNALGILLAGNAGEAPSCASPATGAASACGCGSSDSAPVGFETVRIEKTKYSCALCIVVTDGLCEFDKSLFGAEELPPEEVRGLGRMVAAKVAEKLG
jgi:AhpD family alkylhydroperoxidase